MLRLITRLSIALSGLSMLMLWSGCSTVGEAGEIDPATGLIKSNTVYNVSATIVKQEKIDLTKYQPLILALGADFFKKQTEKMATSIRW